MKTNGGIANIENVLGRFDGEDWYPSGLTKFGLVVLAIALTIAVLLCFVQFQHKVDRDIQSAVSVMNQEYGQLSKQERDILGFEGVLYRVPLSNWNRVLMIYSWMNHFIVQGNGLQVDNHWVLRKCNLDEIPANYSLVPWEDFDKHMPYVWKIFVYGFIVAVEIAIIWFSVRGFVWRFIQKRPLSTYRVLGRRVV